MASNGGRNIDLVVEDMIKLGGFTEAAHAMWVEARRHPETATCECPLIEAMAVLYNDYGLRLVKASTDDH